MLNDPGEVFSMMISPSIIISVLGSRLPQTAVLLSAAELARVPLYRHFVSLGRIVSVTP